MSIVVDFVGKISGVPHENSRRTPRLQLACLVLVALWLVATTCYGLGEGNSVPETSSSALSPTGRREELPVFNNAATTAVLYFGL